MAVGNTAILAIPSQDDYVWKISSEKVPHLTILNLGTQVSESDQAKIAAYLEHVVDVSVERFGLSVDRRGKLGPKDADVLFLHDEWHLPKLAEVRGYLLQNHSVLDGYHGSQQFPEWTPHLTLGFPDSPAKEDTREHPGIHWVHFDKLALWTGDYEGPTFDLKRPEDSFSMSDISMEQRAAIEVLGRRHSVDPEDILHFGVKGMKWGVRRDSDIPGVSAKVSRDAKKDATEYTKAKMFYGEGAGTRRKLINAKVTQKSSNPEYKKAFDHHVGNTNLAKRADQAKGERRRKDVVKSTGKTARGIKNVVVGNPQAASLAALGIVGGAKYLKDSGLTQKAIDSISTLAANRNNRKAVSDLLNSMGIKHTETMIDEFDLEDFLEYNGLIGKEDALTTNNREVALAAIATNLGVEPDDVLHFGTKGMKWGVRRQLQKTPAGQRETFLQGKDGEWMSKVSKNSKVKKVSRMAARDAKSEIRSLKKAYGGVDLHRDSAARDRYDSEMKSILDKNVSSAAMKVHGLSPTRLYETQAIRHPDGSISVISVRRENSKIDSQMAKIAKRDQKNSAKIKHAETDEVTLDDYENLGFLLLTDDSGYVVDILTPFDVLEQDLMDSLDAHFLEHFGVKGMKWGVQNKDSGGGSSGSSKPTRGESKAAKKADAEAHKEWKKNASSAETANKVFQQALKDFEPTMKIINNDANYKGKDLTAKENRGLARDYDATVGTLFSKQLAQTSIDVTMNEKGRAYIYEFDRQTQLLRGREYQAILEQGDEKTAPDYRATLDDLGHIVKLTLVDELKHFGVKGMKWGVRRENPGAKVPSADDARAAAEIRAKISQKGAGTRVASNAELKKLNERLNLETNYARLTAEKSQLDSVQAKLRQMLNLNQSASEAGKAARVLKNALVEATAAKTGARYKK